MTSPTYDEGRLAAIAVRLALSSGLPASSARTALELASRMIGEQQDNTPVRRVNPADRPRPLPHAQGG